MAQPGERTDVEKKIEAIAPRILRGLAAKKNKEVMLYRLNKYSTLVGSTLTGVGLSNPLLSALAGGKNRPNVEEAFTSFNGLPIFFTVAGVVIFLGVILAKNIYASEDIEKKAVQSLGLYESVGRLKLKFEHYLELDEPMEQLGAVHETCIALEDTYAPIMPDDERLDGQLVGDYVGRMITTKSRYWVSEMPVTQRKRR
jgi:hypothetical protein